MEWKWLKETRKIIEKISETIVGSLKRSTKLINLDLTTTKKYKRTFKFLKAGVKKGN